MRRIIVPNENLQPQTEKVKRAFNTQENQQKLQRLTEKFRSEQYKLRSELDSRGSAFSEASRASLNSSNEKSKRNMKGVSARSTKKPPEDRKRCIACWQSYPKSSLTGVITRNRIILWKQHKNTPLTVAETRLHASKKYESINLCKMCDEIISFYLRKCDQKETKRQRDSRNRTQKGPDYQRGIFYGKSEHHEHGLDLRRGAPWTWKLEMKEI